MNSRAGIVVGALAGLLITTASTLAQMNMQPTPRPIVTADNEPWFQAGVPIMHAGITYYPAGPVTQFNPNEMIRSGHHMGVPLYTRTTLEPYSLIFVPLAGGWMQPYERRRDGDLAGTAGSTPPSFPVVRPAEQAGAEFMVQAPAPPSQVGSIADRTAEPAEMPAPTTMPVGTTGPVATSPPLGPLATARRPQGLNGVFIDYGSLRYFADGRAIAFDETLFTRIGEYHGFPVYQRRGEEKTLYIPPVGGASSLVAPYRAR